MVKEKIIDFFLEERGLNLNVNVKKEPGPIPETGALTQRATPKPEESHVQPHLFA
jgi:hypothetical protein